MTAPQSLPWIEPLDLAARVRETRWVLLYSGKKTNYSGRYSYLAHDLEECIKGSTLDAFSARLAESGERFNPLWLGYLGYGLKNSLEQLEEDRPGHFDVPNFCMMRFGAVYEFDHDEKCLRLYSEKPPSLSALSPIPAMSVPKVETLGSNMTKATYLSHVQTIVERIQAGDLYQANLTRKFKGTFASVPQPFSVFTQLCYASPAPYSAFLQLDDIAVLSSSPEQFLSIDAGGHIITRPIKGTTSRHQDAIKDQQAKNALAASDKDRAENLMIVDLMRNDLSRSTRPGSLKTEQLFEITSHANVHHMSSTISGTIRPDITTLEAITGCFPPGSMTGAPKISAINLCSQLERDARGIYSGAIGWFGGDNSAELSVVIRTLLVRGNEFEFQVGGGIVNDSTPEGELQETIDKAKGICLALQIDPARLGQL